MLQNGVADLTARFVWELFSFYNTVLVSQWACRLQRALSVRACSLCAFRRWRLRCGELRDENNGNNRTYTWREPNRYCQTSFNAKDFPWICYQNGLSCPRSLKNVLLSLNIFQRGLLESSWTVVKSFNIKLYYIEHSTTKIKECDWTAYQVDLFHPKPFCSKNKLFKNNCVVIMNATISIH